MEEIWAKLWEIGTPLGMLGIAIVYFHKLISAKDALLAKKDEQIAALNKEMRDNLINTVSNNTVAFTAFKEALK